MVLAVDVHKTVEVVLIMVQAVLITLKVCSNYYYLYELGINLYDGVAVFIVQNRG